MRWQRGDGPQDHVRGGLCGRGRGLILSHTRLVAAAYPEPLACPTGGGGGGLADGSGCAVDPDPDPPVGQARSFGRAAATKLLTLFTYT